MEIWFDMDGTIADLYSVENWLYYLKNEDEFPYAVAAPLVNMARLAKALHKVQSRGIKVGIISWTCKGGRADYNEKVAQAKRKWLAKHLPSVTWNEIKIVEYGTPKSTCGKGILFDDEYNNRNEWGSGAYTPDMIFEVLAKI